MEGKKKPSPGDQRRHYSIIDLLAVSVVSDPSDWVTATFSIFYAHRSRMGSMAGY
jgi:hypothetical protein